jgi:hypothetical protein
MTSYQNICTVALHQACIIDNEWTAAAFVRACYPCCVRIPCHSHEDTNQTSVHAQAITMTVVEALQLLSACVLALFAGQAAMGASVSSLNATAATTIEGTVQQQAKLHASALCACCTHLWFPGSSEHNNGHSYDVPSILSIPDVVGDLRVIVTHGDNGKPSTTQYALFTAGGTRYSLRSLPGRQWRTGMRVRVRGVKTAGVQTSVVGPTASSVSVQGVTVVSATSPSRGVASTMTAPLVGCAPSTLGVLFIIVTMCSQTASITPSVSWAGGLDCDLWPMATSCELCHQQQYVPQH